jgi:hypothetical protein
MADIFCHSNTPHSKLYQTKNVMNCSRKYSDWQKNLGHPQKRWRGQDLLRWIHPEMAYGVLSVR